MYLLPFFETSTWSFKIVEPAFKIYFLFLIQCIIVTDVYFKQFILINSFKEAVLHYDLIDLLTFTRTSRILCIYKNPKFDMYNFSKTKHFIKLATNHNITFSKELNFELYCFQEENKEFSYLTILENFGFLNYREDQTSRC